MKKKTKARYLPEKFRLGRKVRILSKEERHEMPPEAFLPRNMKVRVTLYLDSDIVEFFKELSERGARHQTQINAVLREVMERSKQADPQDAGAKLRQARGLIDDVIRKTG